MRKCTVHGEPKRAKVFPDVKCLILTISKGTLGSSTSTLRYACYFLVPTEAVKVSRLMWKDEGLA